MMRSFLAPVVAVLTTGLLVSACGGSSGSDSSTSSSSATKQLPRAEFAQKADAICTASDKKLRTLFPRFNPATATKAQLTGAADGLASANAIVRQQVSQVSALGEPSEAAPKQAWHKLHASLESESLPAFQKMTDDARAGDAKAFTADLKQLGSLDAPEGKLAKIIGFKVCGK